VLEHIDFIELYSILDPFDHQVNKVLKECKPLADAESGQNSHLFALADIGVIPEEVHIDQLITTNLSSGYILIHIENQKLMS
jgi:hypothetical protein